MIREITTDDQNDLLNLYRQLRSQEIINEFQFSEKLNYILTLDHIKIIGFENNNHIVASSMVAKIDGLSYGSRSFAIIENVITDKLMRNNGYGKLVVKKCIEIANAWNCYKVILETGSKENLKLQFYTDCGFTIGEKTAFIKRFE